MSRKNVYNYTIVDDVDASADFNTFLKPTNINYLDNCGLQLIFPNTLLGEFQVWVSNDQVQGDRLPTKWSQLDFGAPVIIDNTNTSILINMNQLSFSWLAVVYAADSVSPGTGNMTVKMTTKMVGG